MKFFYWKCDNAKVLIVLTAEQT